MDPTVIANLILTLEPEAQALIMMVIGHLKRAAPVKLDPIPSPLPTPAAPNVVKGK